MIVRDYRRDDAEPVCRLFFGTVRSVNLGDYTGEQVRAWAPKVPEPANWHARMSGRHTFVAEENEEILGFAELEENGHLDMLYVRRDAGGRGIGTRLCDAAERRAGSIGVRTVFTEASITAQPFFEGRGFVTLHRNDLVVRGAALTNYSMEKALR